MKNPKNESRPIRGENVILPVLNLFMRYLFTLLVILFTSFSGKAFAAYDSVAASNCLHVSVLEQPVLLQNVHAQHQPVISPYPRYGVHTRRDPNQVATGLLIGGIICTATGAALMGYGIHQYEPDGRYNTMPLLEMLAGAIVGAGGISLTATGIVIKIQHRND